jgi:hypothetical protein
MRQTFVDQFKRPTGLLERLAGWIIAHRGSNLRRNEWVVSLLETAPHHWVLELGCGCGLALERGKGPSGTERSCPRRVFGT